MIPGNNWNKQTSSLGSRVLVLRAGRAERHYWRDLWAYRELFAILAWRDVAVRYKQTVIGVAWAVVRPFLTMVVFTVVFGRLARLPSERAAPYPIMVFAGMLPWFLFSTILSDASNSFVGNANLSVRSISRASSFRPRPRSWRWSILRSTSRCSLC